MTENPTPHDIQRYTPADEKRGYQILVGLSFLLGLIFFGIELGVEREAFYHGAWTTFGLLAWGVSITFLSVLDAGRDAAAREAAAKVAQSHAAPSQKVPA